MAQSVVNCSCSLLRDTLTNKIHITKKFMFCRITYEWSVGKKFLFLVKCEVCTWDCPANHMTASLKTCCFYTSSSIG